VWGVHFSETGSNGVKKVNKRNSETKFFLSHKEVGGQALKHDGR